MMLISLESLYGLNPCLHTFLSILRNWVLEAIQTHTVSNFGTFHYMFMVNVGLYKEREFALLKHHQKFKKKRALYHFEILLHRSSVLF